MDKQLTCFCPFMLSNDRMPGRCTQGWCGYPSCASDMHLSAAIQWEGVEKMGQTALQEHAATGMGRNTSNFCSYSKKNCLINAGTRTWSGYEVSVLGETENLSGCGPKQPGLIGFELCVGLDNLHRSCLIPAMLCI